MFLKTLYDMLSNFKTFFFPFIKKVCFIFVCGGVERECSCSVHRGIKSPGAGFTGSCGLPDMGAESPALVFWKNSECS